MTMISKGSFWISASDRFQNGDFSLISWQIIKGVTKNNLSAPVLKPILISVWSRGKNSPSDVCLDRTNFALILHWTIRESRRFPTLRTKLNCINCCRCPYRNIKQYFPSRCAMTALSENIRESVRSFGFDILMKMQPTMNASISVPRRHWITSSRIASGHSSVIDLRPKPKSLVSYCFHGRNFNLSSYQFR